VSTFQMLPVEQLVIDPLYQRHMTPGSKKKVAVMASDWDPAMVGALEVSHRGNGTYAVMDGQHRYLAAKAAGVKELPAFVHEGLTTFEESRRFERLNTERKNPQTTDIFRSQLVSGNVHARNIAEVANKLGLTISLTHARGLMTLQSVGTLKVIEDTLGPEGLEFALTTAMKAWPADEKRWHAYLLSAIAGFDAIYSLHPKYTRARLTESLSLFSPKAVLQRINSYGLASITTGGTSKVGRLIRPSARQAFLEIYNYRRSTNALPELTNSEVFLIARGGNPWAKK
jgi:ParB-like nuclease domain